MANDIVQDGNTTAWTFVSGVSAVVEVKKQDSIDADASGIKLVNDNNAPGNSKYYGTDSSGVKGFFDVPGGSGSITVEAVSGTPTVVGVTTIKVTDGTLTDDGGGVVTIATGGSGSGTSLGKVKSSDQSISTTVLTTVTELQIGMAAGESWAFTINLFLQSATTPINTKYTVVGPTGSTGLWCDLTNNFNGVDLGTTLTAFTSQPPNNFPVTIVGSVTNGGTPGSLVVQVAWDTSSSEATTVRAFSSLQANKQ